VEPVRRASVPGIEAVRGDAMNGEFCTETVRGASAVYHCMKPEVRDRGVGGHAAEDPGEPRGCGRTRAGTTGRARQRLHAGPPGRQAPHRGHASQPLQPQGRDPRTASRRLLAAHRRGDVQASRGRASDFFGPAACRPCSKRASGRACSPARTRRSSSNPTPPTYHYIPDVAAAWPHSVLRNPT